MQSALSMACIEAVSWRVWVGRGIVAPGRTQFVPLMGGPDATAESVPYPKPVTAETVPYSQIDL